MTSIIRAVWWREADTGLYMSSFEGSSYGNGILGGTCRCMCQVQLSLLCASGELFPLSAPPSCQSVLRFLLDSSGLCLWTQYLCPQTHALRILILEVMVLGGGWGSWDEIKGTRMEPLWLGLVLRKEPPERVLSYFAVWDHHEASCLVTRDWTFTQCRLWPSFWAFWLSILHSLERWFLEATQYLELSF